MEQSFLYRNEFRHDEWFVLAKFDSMKDELLCNTLCRLSVHQWLDLQQEALAYRDCARCRRLVGDDMSGSHMDSTHLLAVLAYSNMDIVRHHLLDTFARRASESTLALKSRHSNVS